MKKIIKIVVSFIVIGVILYLIPLFLIMKNSESEIENEIDYLIVLGARVFYDRPSATLRYRLDGAIEYYNDNPDVKIVVTGGQGLAADEIYPEAYVMKWYLVNAGIPAEQILVEDQSTSTFENLLFAQELIETNSRIGIVTTDFHIYRSALLCRRIFEQECEMKSVQNFQGDRGRQVFFREPLAFYKSLLIDRVS
jgi:uncharacterized SAM-binding protein YcdF (DUF218 family)